MSDDNLLRDLKQATRGTIVTRAGNHVRRRLELFQAAVDRIEELEARLERLEKAFSTSNRRYWKDVYNQQPEEG